MLVPRTVASFVVRFYWSAAVVTIFFVFYNITRMLIEHLSTYVRYDTLGGRLEGELVYENNLSHSAVIST